MNRTVGHPPHCHCETCNAHGAEPHCDCVVKNRNEGETQREWLKRWMCMWHWMETDYYQSKLSHNRFLVDAPDTTPE